MAHKIELPPCLFYFVRRVGKFKGGKMDLITLGVLFGGLYLLSKKAGAVPVSPNAGGGTTVSPNAGGGSTPEISNETGYIPYTQETPPVPLFQNEIDLAEVTLPAGVIPAEVLPPTTVTATGELAGTGPQWATVPVIDYSSFIREYNAMADRHNAAFQSFYNVVLAPGDSRLREKIYKIIPAQIQNQSGKYEVIYGVGNESFPFSEYMTPQQINDKLSSLAMAVDWLEKGFFRTY